MPLVAADGLTHLNQAILPLTSYTVSWFTDGRRLLEHATTLHAVRAKLVCLACESHGGFIPNVYVAKRSGDHVFVACPHRPEGGKVRMDRPLDVAALLQALGWGLRCSSCGDALRGDNDPATAITLHVTCPCTSREFAVAVV